MLQIVNLNLYRNSKKLCSDLSVDVDQGSCLLITGENGSGKSSLIECLIGKLKPFHGQVLMDGHDLHHLDKKDKKTFLESTGIVLQEIALRKYDTVIKSITHQASDENEVEHMLNFLGFEDRAQEVIHNLSYAERRSLDLARSLINHPHLLIWDEPFHSLDFKNKEKFKTAVNDLKKSGATAIIASVNSDDFDFLNPEKIIQL